MLLDKFKEMAAFQSELRDRKLKAFGAVTDEILSATEGVVEGRRVILAGTNNSLGLSAAPAGDWCCQRPQPTTCSFENRD